VAYKIIDNDYDRLKDWWSDFMGYPVTMQAMIGLEKDGEIVCIFGYDNFNGKSCQQHIVYKQGEYVPRNYVWFVYYYPFVQIGIDLLIGMTPANNEKALRLSKHAGFVEKYRIVGAHPEGDIILSTLLKQDCRFLNYSKGH
jgi:hypothetical protein